MRKYSLFLYLFSFLLLAQESDKTQEDVHQVASDVVTVLGNGVILGDQKKGCHENDLALVPVVDIYDCDCEHGDKEYQSNPHAMEIVPKEHVLQKNHGIHLLNIGAEVNILNDNTFLELANLVDGDDRGNTFGADFSAWGLLENQKKNKIRIGLDYTMRQYTMPIQGNTFLNFDTGEVNVWGKDELGNRVLIAQDIRQGLQEEYGDRTFLSNQASMTVQALEVDMMIEPPREDGKIGLNYGLGIGYKDLNDTPGQLGANVQDWHHRNMDIYRFEWDTFSNMIIDGRESYLTLRPQARVNFPTFEYGICRLQSNAEVSVLFNTPIKNTGSDYSLNLVEPKLTANVTMGVIPLKHDPQRSMLEWHNSITYDPMNRAPTNVDPGNKGFARTGLQFNFELSKRTRLYLVPLEFYVPIGNQSNDHLLSGGNTSSPTVAFDNQDLLKRQLQNDVIGTWAQAGIVIKLGK